VGDAWDQASGAWGITSGHLESSDQGAEIEFLSGTGEANISVVFANVKIDHTLEATYRILLDYLDSDNYLEVEYVISRAATVFDPYISCLSIYECIEGVRTKRASRPHPYNASFSAFPYLSVRIGEDSDGVPLI